MISSVIRNAVAIVIDDPMAGGQGLIAISRDGCFFKPPPGGVLSIRLPELRRYFEQQDVRLAAPLVANLVLAELAKMEEQ